MALLMRGHDGTVKYGYHVAARLSAWTLEGDRLDARPAEEPNDTWLDSDGPLDLHLVVGRRVWIWRGVTLLGKGASLAVRVNGSPEVRDAN